MVTTCLSTFGTDLHAQSVINKISASELRRKFIKSALLVGFLQKTSPFTFWAVDSGWAFHEGRDSANQICTSTELKCLKHHINDLKKKKEFSSLLNPLFYLTKIWGEKEAHFFSLPYFFFSSPASRAKRNWSDMNACGGGGGRSLK